MLYVGIFGAAPPPRGGTKGALYKSSDGGQTFGADLLDHCHSQTNPLGTIDCTITSLAIHPTNSNMLWLGQRGGDPQARVIMRSDDGGQTWASASLDIVNTWTRVEISPANPSVLWALSSQGLAGQWVYLSTDSGLNWSGAELDNTLNPWNRALWPDLVDEQLAWESSGVGLFQTRDGAQTWDMINGLANHELGAVVPYILYGIKQGFPDLSSVQLSTDGGSHWFDLGMPGMSGLSELENPYSLAVVKQ